MRIFKPLLLLLFILNAAYAQQTNVALHKPAEANSEMPGFPAKNVTDGVITRNSKWMSANVKPPHILEINLEKYCNISSIIVHTGIPDAERTPSEASQAAGFWSAKNFKMQYWDDANWSDIPNTEVHENRLNDVKYTFAQPINTFKVRFVCDDGEPVSIMEIEVLGTEIPGRVVAGGGKSDIEKKTIRTTDQDVAIKVGSNVVGKTMRYVGYNQGYYMPGSNASGWMEYAGVNSVRVWITLNSYAPLSDIQVDKSINTVDEFDKRKAELRSSSENNTFLKWDKLLPLYSNTEKTTNTNPMIFSYSLTELKRLGIDPIIQFGSTDFNNTWSNKWQQWQRYYALAYYAAKTGDVTMFAMQNEPNHKNSGPMKLDQWISAMQIVSDALTCAIEDVDKKYGKNLKARMVGPVTAGNNPEWWTAVAKSQRTDYHGKTIDHDLLGIFSTHSYNSPAAGYANRVNDIRKLLADNHPQGKALPIVYTEIGRWMNAYLIDKEETMDSPSLFTEWAGIYTNNTKNGAYGMWAFKFSNTVSETYPFGVKSGHHLTWQGKRIVEDAYTDIAKGKTVTASFNDPKWSANLVTDGDKSDRSAWHSDSTSAEKWLTIDLGQEQELGSSVIYTGSAYGVYTSPDRVKNFKLQYWGDGTWKDITGTVEKDNKYAQVFREFKQPVKTSKVRFASTDPGMIKVREIKLFGAHDGPAKDQHDYDVSGIQRTGEVVHLFAKGFKDEHPIYETKPSVADDNLDAMTSYDEKSGNYYMWLVQRGLYRDHLTIDLSALNVKTDAPVTAETVSPQEYGEVTDVMPVNPNKRITVTLPKQGVVLLTIPSEGLTKAILSPAATATVYGGDLSNKNYNSSKELTVALNAANPQKNAVSYVRFNVSGKNLINAKRILLKVNGYNATDDSVFRFHVYGMPASEWNQQKLNWNNAPQLDKKEALITEVGQKAYVAGELAMSHQQKDHYLDVTQLVKAHAGKSITFALVRETRQLGDDEDKGKKVLIGSAESLHKPELLIWSVK
jgi:hypothetical protein